MRLIELTDFGSLEANIRAHHGHVQIRLPINRDTTAGRVAGPACCRAGASERNSQLRKSKHQRPPFGLSYLGKEKQNE